MLVTWTVRFNMGNIIFVAFYRKIFTKIMLSMLKLNTNYSFHELFLTLKCIIM
jgi:hypothetical protein